MTTWRNVPDEIFLQATRNQCLNTLGSVPDAPETEAQKQKVITQGKEFYEKYPDWVKGIEEEIARLLA